MCKENNTNEVGPVQEYLNNIKYDKNKTISNNEAIEYGSTIRTGTTLNHLFIFLTSLTMIMMMTIIDLPHHIDCTYKLCERGFPLLVFGISDISGQFFPIAFSILSHEQEDDFSTFFRTLLDFCRLLNLSPAINHLIQDACGACGNAAVACLGPNVKILMCFFHVQKKFNDNGVSFV